MRRKKSGWILQGDLPFISRKRYCYFHFAVTRKNGGLWHLDFKLPAAIFLSISLCQQLLFIKRWTCVTVKRIIPVVSLPFRGDQINKNITSKPLDIISMVSKKIKIHICLSLSSLCKKFISSYITFLRPNIDIWLYVWKSGWLSIGPLKIRNRDIHIER